MTQSARRTILQLVLILCVGSTVSAQSPGEAPEPTRADTPITGLRASLSRTAGEIPHNRAAHQLGQTGSIDAQFSSRPWMPQNCEWTAPATKHLPLLFEEPNLERMGYLDSCTFDALTDEECVWTEECLQPLSSGLHFLGNAAIIPYRCGYQSPCEPVYTLGHDRPGSPVCYRKHHLPLSPRGAAYQAGFLTGLVFFIP
jgi:hypothetical protein